MGGPVKPQPAWPWKVSAKSWKERPQALHAKLCSTTSAGHSWLKRSCKGQVLEASVILPSSTAVRSLRASSRYSAGLSMLRLSKSPSHCEQEATA